MKKLFEIVSAAGPLVVLVLLALFVVCSGCAGSLGWSNSTALPRGSYDEERIDRVGPRSSYRSPCDGASSYSIPSGYQLVPSATSGPCQ
jgi:hypothetical protein